MELDVKYETGVLWQDYQHKQLIDLFGKIKTARSNHKEKNLYRYTIAFLVMYVNHHFKLEEEYMDKYGYPGKGDHHKEHQGFVKELKAFKSEHNDYSEEGIDDLIMRLANWIMNHILEDDQKLGQFILKKEQSNPLNAE